MLVAFFYIENYIELQFFIYERFENAIGKK